MKESLTIQEVKGWAEYIHLRGSLNTGRRIEKALGQYHYSYLSSVGAKNIKIEDFIPHEYLPEKEDQEDTLNPEALKVMMSGQANKSKKGTGTKIRRGNKHG